MWRAEEVDWGHNYIARHHVCTKRWPTISAPQPEAMDSTEDAGFGGCSFLSRIAGGIGEPSGHTGGRDSSLGTIEPATPLI